MGFGGLPNDFWNVAFGVWEKGTEAGFGFGLMLNSIDFEVNDTKNNDINGETYENDFAHTTVTTAEIRHF